MAGPRVLSVILIAAAALAGSAAQDLAPGKILVAKPELADPNFAQTVVLIVHYDSDKGAVGLILNRPTKDALVYEGGPVQRETAQAVLRSREKPERATRIFGDIYVSGSKELIEKSVRGGASPSRFRLYVGYGGWAAGQLEREIEIGGWSVLRANASTVFDDDPESLWQRLQHDTETRIASIY